MPPEPPIKLLAQVRWSPQMGHQHRLTVPELYHGLVWTIASVQRADIVSSNGHLLDWYLSSKQSVKPDNSNSVHSLSQSLLLGQVGILRWTD